VTAEPLLPFDTDDPSFTLEVELGMVWVHTGEGRREFTVHVENAEMMLRVAEARGLSVRADPLGEFWLAVVFS